MINDIEREINLHPLKILRIVKGVTASEMAKLFEVTGAYIGAVETSKKQMKLATLVKGLERLNISLVDYCILLEFSEELLNSSFSNEQKYRLMLLKAIGITEPEIRESIEELLETQYFQNSSKTKILKNLLRC